MGSKVIEDIQWSTSLEITGTCGPGALAWLPTLPTLPKWGPTGCGTAAPPKKTGSHQDKEKKISSGPTEKPPPPPPSIFPIDAVS